MQDASHEVELEEVVPVETCERKNKRDVCRLDPERVQLTAMRDLFDFLIVWRRIAGVEDVLYEGRPRS